jgi:hypothetical protein
MKKLKIRKSVGLLLPFLVLAIVLIVGCVKDQLIPTQYAIDASTGPGGTLIPKVGQILVEKGKNQVVTPKPDVGYELETMIVDDVDVTNRLVNNTYPFTEVASNHTVHATFKKTLLLPLIAHPWEFEARYKKFVGTTDADWERTQAPSGSWTYTFYESDKLNMKWADGTEMDIGYLLKGDSLSLGMGIKTKILVLNDDRMELFYISKYHQGPGDPWFPDSEIKEVYKKPTP